MKWNKNIKEIPPKTEVLVLTDLGNVLIAWRKRKNGRFLDVKAPTHDKIEWLENDIDLNGKWGGKPYCPIVYWSKIDNLTKKQHNAVYESSPRWNKMFEQ